MSIKDQIISRSLVASPLGTIPLDFTRLVDLCRKAHIRYNDTSIENLTMRVWRIVPDKTENVSSCKTFMNFCKLLDYITFKKPSHTRNQILLEALSDQYNPWLLLSSFDLHNKFAKEGIGYDMLQRKKEKKACADSLPDF